MGFSFNENVSDGEHFITRSSKNSRSFLVYEDRILIGFELIKWESEGHVTTFLEERGEEGKIEVVIRLDMSALEKEIEWREEGEEGII